MNSAAPSETMYSTPSKGINDENEGDFDEEDVLMKRLNQLKSGSSNDKNAEEKNSNKKNDNDDNEKPIRSRKKKRRSSKKRSSNVSKESADLSKRDSNMSNASVPKDTTTAAKSLEAPEKLIDRPKENTVLALYGAENHQSSDEETTNKPSQGLEMNRPETVLAMYDKDYKELKSSDEETKRDEETKPETAEAEMKTGGKENDRDSKNKESRRRRSQRRKLSRKSSSSTLLPYKWDPENLGENMTVLEDRPHIVRREVAKQSTDGARGYKGYSRGCHTFEILFNDKPWGSHCAVGICTQYSSLHCPGYKYLLGSDDQSWGWDIPCKSLVHLGEFKGDLSFPDQDKEGAVIESQVPRRLKMIMDLDNGQLKFDLGNSNIITAFTDLKSAGDEKLYPAVTMVYGLMEAKIRLKESKGGEERKISEQEKKNKKTEKKEKREKEKDRERRKKKEQKVEEDVENNANELAKFVSATNDFDDNDLSKFESAMAYEDDLEDSRFVSVKEFDESKFVTAEHYADESVPEPDEKYFTPQSIDREPGGKADDQFYTPQAYRRELEAEKTENLETIPEQETQRETDNRYIVPKRDDDWYKTFLSEKKTPEKVEEEEEEEEEETSYKKVEELAAEDQFMMHISHGWDFVNRGGLLQLYPNVPCIIVPMPNLQDKVQSVRCKRGFSKGRHTWIIRELKFYSPTVLPEEFQEAHNDLVIGIVNQEQRLFNFGFSLNQLGSRAWGFQPNSKLMWHDAYYTSPQDMPGTFSVPSSLGDQGLDELEIDMTLGMQMTLDRKARTLTFRYEGQELCTIQNLRGKVFYPFVLFHKCAPFPVEIQYVEGPESYIEKCLEETRELCSKDQEESTNYRMLLKRSSSRFITDQAEGAARSAFGWGQFTSGVHTSGLIAKNVVDIVAGQQPEMMFSTYTLCGGRHILQLTTDQPQQFVIGLVSPEFSQEAALQSAGYSGSVPIFGDLYSWGWNISEHLIYHAGRAIGRYPVTPDFDPSEYSAYQLTVEFSLLGYNVACFTAIKANGEKRELGLAWVNIAPEVSVAAARVGGAACSLKIEYHAGSWKSSDKNQSPSAGNQTSSTCTVL